MVDPPDLESNHYYHLSEAATAFNEGISTHYTLKSLNNRNVDIQPLYVTKPKGITRRLSRFTASSLLLLVCLFALLIPCTLSHVLPLEGGNYAIEARSSTQYDSIRNFDTSILEGGSVLTKRQDEDLKRNIQYSPPTQSPKYSFLRKRENDLPKGREIGFAILVVVLVLMSGVFAGLTLGYMSLDETQLQVLMTTGDDVQKARAAKIMPIRKDGHLLLTTLLIANMITNEVSQRFLSSMTLKHKFTEFCMINADSANHL